jgi:hypothetical protein
MLIPHYYQFSHNCSKGKDGMKVKSKIIRPGGQKLNINQSSWLLDICRGLGTAGVSLAGRFGGFGITGQEQN